MNSFQYVLSCKCNAEKVIYVYLDRELRKLNIILERKICHGM
jgi:hypothetical protein